MLDVFLVKMEKQTKKQKLVMEFLRLLLLLSRDDKILNMYELFYLF